MPDIADAVVDMTETGSALRAAGLKVIETLLVSHTELIANPKAAEDPGKRHAMAQILTLLQGTLEARGKVLVKLNVSAENLDAVLAVLPSMRAPTVSELSGGGAFALETVVPKADINVLIPALRDHGRDGHPRAPALQDRPLTWPTRSVPPDRISGASPRSIPPGVSAPSPTTPAPSTRFTPPRLRTVPAASMSAPA